MEGRNVNALNEQPPRTVSVKITPAYSNFSFRPDKFKVTYKIEGKKVVIQNQNWG
ncbi:DNA/RNA non-specific endonuclease [Virgibacillus sp. MSJ-26]|uniref:DNA/RNA non-specific endonuclease n=1 Tax=Virgibacillus sp. MSJ-26 TaxID=2841522 RepID=UPI00352FF0CD